MPKYFCDYCDTYLTHDSPSVRKTHNGGRKHKEMVRMFYQNWMEEQAQKLVDATTKAMREQFLHSVWPAKAFKEGKIQQPGPPGPGMMRPPGGAMIPPPHMHGPRGMPMPPMGFGPPMGGFPPYGMPMRPGMMPPRGYGPPM